MTTILTCSKRAKTQTTQTTLLSPLSNAALSGLRKINILPAPTPAPQLVSSDSCSSGLASPVMEAPPNEGGGGNDMVEDTEYKETASGNITNSTFNSSLPGQPQQFEDEFYDERERQDGDGDGYMTDNTVKENSSDQHSPGEKEKVGNEKGHLQGDPIYDINNPLEREMMEQQLQVEAGFKNNLLKVSTPHCGSAYSTAHNSPADNQGSTNALALWQEDSQIHSEHIYAALHNIPEANSLYEDCAVLRDQLSFLKKGLQISGSFWLTLQQCSTHFTKYSDPSAYERMRAQLEYVAHSRGDYQGRENYARPLLHILHEQRRYVNEKLSCTEINQLAKRKHPPPPSPSASLSVPPNLLANTVDVGANSDATGQRSGGRGGRGGRGKGNGGNGRDRASSAPPPKDRKPCSVCNGQHANLFYCSQFTTFIPDNGNKFKKLPLTVCKGCFKSNGNGNDKTCHKPDAWFVCQTHKINYLLCNCQQYLQQRQWMIRSHDPSQGYGNINRIKSELNIVVSRRTVIPREKTASSLLNCRIGASYCPAEIISVCQKDGSVFCVKLHYESGATHCLRNELIKPVVVKEVQSVCPIQLSTIQSVTSATRTIATVHIKHTEFTCILVKSLNVDSKCMPVPVPWLKYKADWSEQDTEYDSHLPQILIGSDKAVLHPQPVLGSDGLPIETATARLLRSVITDKFIAHGWEEPVTDIQFCDTDSTNNDLPVMKDQGQSTSKLPEAQISRKVDFTPWIPDRSKIHNITSDSTDSDDLMGTSTTTVQMHSPKTVCNAAVLMSNDL